MTIPAWEELETKGYVIVRGFFEPDIRLRMLEDFRHGVDPETYPFGFKPVGRRILAAVRAQLEGALKEIRERTSLTTDTINFLTLSHYITTRLAQRTTMIHQDFDLDYRLSGDHVNYLNFWVPLLKPDPLRSGLNLVPLDSLQKRCLEASKQLQGQGGHRLVPESGRTSICGDGRATLDAEPEVLGSLDFDVRELMVTPSLEPGDLVLMRGDLFHGTQDLETERVAISIRATSSQKWLKRDRVSTFPDDPAAKIIAMLQACFAHLDRPQVTVAEFADFAQGQR